MNCEERVWAALNREPVDTVPTLAVSVNENVCDEILGKPPRSAFDAMDELKEQYPDDWVERVNNIMGELEINIFSKVMEAASVIGYDVCGVGYIPFIFENKTRMIDVFGRIYKIVNNNGNILPYYVDGLIKNQKDWENWEQFILL